MAVDVVLGVSMAASSVRMVLVEGRTADGVTVDRDSFDFDAGAAAPEQVLAAILGTREGATEGGHHLTSTGVAWTDHAAAARLRQSLRANGVEDVVLVSELHAAGALAQAIGQSLDYGRTALLFLQPGTATLAVVRAADGAVVRVESPAPDTGAAELADMVAALRDAAEPPEAVFVVGAGIDIAATRAEIERRTAWPVHAPDDGEFALARGAALAAASAPRYDATTVGLAPAEDTAAGPTQLAAAGYMAPLGYSAVIDEEDLLDGDPLDSASIPAGEPGRRPFVVAGGALSGFLVVGLVALTISLAVVIRPAADQRPDPTGNAVVPVSQTPASAGRDPGAPTALETIPAPIPVVQQAPRTVVVTPPAQAPAPQAPPGAASAPVPPPAAAAPVPAAPVPAAPAPAPVAPAPAVPAPAAAPAPIVAPIVVPIPIGPLLPSILAPPAVGAPVPRTPATTQTTPTAQSPTSTTSSPPPSTTTPPADSETAEPTTTQPSASASSSSSTSAQTAEAPVTTTSAPAGGGSAGAGSESGSASSAGDSGSGGSSDSAGPSTPLLPVGD